MLTATIITHNEARNIERCLRSLIGVADEIVVVDSGSTDDTVEICRRYGCTVASRPFTGFGSQRQYAAGLARAPYVLSIDADEVLSTQLRHSITELKEKGFAHRMYSFRVVNHVCGTPMRHSGMEPVVQTRLFDKRYANWDLLDVGERLSYPGDVNPAFLPGDLLHYRCETFGELSLKEMRHSELRARLMAAAGISAPAPMQWLRAVAAYAGCMFSQGAVFDGPTGRAVAGIRFRTTLHAYRLARRINTGKK